MVKVPLVGELFMIFFSVSKYAAAICRLLKVGTMGYKSLRHRFINILLVAE